MSNENQVPQELTEVPSVVEQVTEEAKETVKEMSPDELFQLQVLAARQNSGTFKQKLTGMPSLNAKAKVSKSWHNGKLISTAERNALSWEEVHASNNVIRKAK